MMHTAAVAASTAKLKTPAPKDHIRKSLEPAPSRNRADGHVVTLETAVQYIMAVLKTAETEHEDLPSL
jgi:hypothetical protein